jgi:hypothetical protein
MNALIGVICFALVNGGTLCLERAVSGDFKIQCLTPKDLGDWQGVKSCDVATTGPTTVIVPERQK